MIRKLYNPTASKDNLMVLHQSQTGCCGSTLKICQYRSADMAALSVTALTLVKDEGNQVILFSETANTVAKLQNQLIAALATGGYDITQKEDIVIGMDGSDYYVELLGEAVAYSLTNSAAPVLFTAKCNKVVVCEHTISIDALTTITLAGETTTLADGGLVYGTDAVGDVTTAFADAFEDEDAIQGVTVTDDVVAEKWVVTIKALQGSKIRVNGLSLYPFNCGPVYLPE